MYVTLFFVGLIAGILSGSVGFGGGMVLLPVITYFYGIEVAVPVATIAQLMSNLSRAAMGWRDLEETGRSRVSTLLLSEYGIFFAYPIRIKTAGYSPAMPSFSAILLEISCISLGWFI